MSQFKTVYYTDEDGSIRSKKVQSNGIVLPDKPVSTSTNPFIRRKIEARKKSGCNCGK